ncbi:MAG: hypothetical protein LBI10_12670 [Deltaproteobacteria bacterium]|jgi:hypothetical protein|nr:hypothetical protein [Deltaproteobacteria bacterium]
MERALAILFSAGSFVGFFALINLALMFWGRQILRLIKVKPANYDNILTLAAGLCGLIFVAESIRTWTRDYNLFLFLFYILGLIGSFIDLYLNNIRILFNKPDVLKNLLSSFFKNRYFTGSLLLALALSSVYSAIWPSGKMDVWFRYDSDYFIWIFHAEQILGGINPNVLEISPFFEYLALDCFGTTVTLAFIATAKFQSPLWASPAISVTLLAWAASAIFSVIRKAFNFGFWLALILAAGVALGALFNYVSFAGMFGHLIGLITFLMALEALLAPPEFLNSPPQTIRKLFLPLFVLFLAYQAGFIIYLPLIAFASGVKAFCNLKGHSLGLRVVKTLWRGIWPVFFVTLLSGLLAPGVFYHSLIRFTEIAAQTAGFSLPFFSPWFFTGLPVFTEGAFNSNVRTPLNGFSPLWPFAPLFAVVVLLFLVALKTNPRRAQNDSSSINADAGQGAVIVLTLLYLASLAGYLALVIFFGNHGYKIWKVATYAALPLSFVPTALFALTLTNLGPKSRHWPAKILLATGCVLGVNFLSSPPLLEWPSRYYYVLSANGFIKSLENIRDNIPKTATVLLHFKHLSPKLISYFVFSHQNYYKVKFTYITSYIFGNSYHFNINKNFIVISNIRYKGIVNGTNISSTWGVFNIYDYDRLATQGYAAIKSGGLNFEWEVDYYPVHVDFLIPKALIGRELVYSVSLEPIGVNAPGCQKARLGLIAPNGAINWTQDDYANLKITVPASLSSNGTLKTILEIGPFPKPKGRPGQSLDTSLLCSFRIQSFDLILK